MAHKIYTDKNGKASFASAIVPAWHGLGQILPNIMTASEAIEAAGLNYEIEKRPIYTHDENGEKSKQLGGFFATVRADTDTPLGIVGQNYAVVQNRDCFGFFDAIVGEGAAVYETAGVLGNGERIFITAKLPDQIIVGNDCIDNYLFLTTSHDGTAGIRAAFTPTRIVCANTLALALKDGKHMVHIKHTTNASYLLDQAHTLMNITKKQIGGLEETFNAMRKVKVSDQLLQDLIFATFQTTDGITIEEASTQLKGTVANVVEYHFNHDTQATAETKGTLYGFVNAVTGYFQNGKSWKSPEKKLISTIDGNAAETNNRAFNIALQVLENSN